MRHCGPRRLDVPPAVPYPANVMTQRMKFTVRSAAAWAAMALLLIVPLAPRPAAAQSPAQVATTWDLLGAWSSDCSIPPSRLHTWLSYVVRDDKLFYEQNYGDGRSSNEIVSARIRPNGDIEIVMMFTAVSPPQTRLNVNSRGPNSRFRTIESKDVNTGEYSIRDGLVSHNNQPSKWLSRCATPPSS
jgi:hypothetical protein